MPTPRYDDASLAAQEKARKLGIAIQPQAQALEGADDGLSEYARLMDEAKGSLANADRLSAETDSANLGMLPARLAALQSKPDTRGPVRKITEPIADVGGAIGTASIPAMGINPAIAALLATGAGVASLPDYLRRMIAPEGDETRPGMVETGLTAASFAPELMALSRAAKSTGRAGKYVRAASEEIPYRAGSGADIAGARGAEQAEANALLRGERTAPKGPLGDSLAMEGLRKAVSKEQNLSPVARFYRADPQARIGGEGRMTGQFQEGAGGLDDISAGRYQRNTLPSPTDSRITGLPPEAAPAVAAPQGPLSPLDALSRASNRSIWPEASPLDAADTVAAESALSPIEQLARRPGMMSDAERRAAQDLKWKRGKSKTPSAETARERRKR